MGTHSKFARDNVSRTTQKPGQNITEMISDLRPELGRQGLENQAWFEAWFEACFEACINARSREQAMDAFDGLFDAIGKMQRDEDLVGLSTLLRAMAERSDKIDPFILMSCLRLTYLDRRRIASWGECRDKIRIQLAQRGYDPEEFLDGLLPTETA